MENTICPICGGTMHFDDFTRTMICSVCGKSMAVASAPAPSPAPAPDPVPASTPAAAPEKPAVETSADIFPETPAAEPPVVAPVKAASKPEVPTVSAVVIPASEEETRLKIRALMRNGQFPEALDMLSKLPRGEKDSSASLLLSLLCGYQVDGTEALLKKVAGSPLSIQKLIFRPDWDIISRRNPSAGDFALYVKEYFALCLMQSGTSIHELRRKTKGPRKTTHMSTLAKMDEEDQHNADRTAQLKEAKGYGYKTMAEKMKDMVANFDEYAPAHMGESSWMNERLIREREEITAMAIAGEARRMSTPIMDEPAKKVEPVSLPQVRPDMSPEEILSRQEELLLLINQKEQKILE